MKTHTITREENNIVVKVYYHSQPDGETWHSTLRIATGSKLEAELKAQDFQKCQDEFMKEVRRIAYNQGWKDAKAHRSGKANTFTACNDSKTDFAGYRA